MRMWFKSRRTNAHRYGSGAIGIILIALASINSAYAIDPGPSRIIEDVSTVASNGTTSIQVFFAAPVRYVAHSLSPRGDNLQIKISFISTRELDQNALTSNESFSLTPSRVAPVTEVSYEGDFTDIKTVNIRFRRSVAPTVSQGKDFRSIIISFPNGERDERDAEQPAREPAPEPAPLPTEPRRLVPSAAMEGKQVSVNTAYPYVLNLQSTQLKPEQLKLPDLPVFSRYRVYFSEFESKGKTWYRLRLGFFKDAVQAERARQEVLSAFPQAWISKADVKERKASSQTAIVFKGIKLTDKTAVVAKKPPIPEKAAKTAAPVSGKSSDLMEKAREAMINKQYRVAIGIYTKLLQLPDKSVHQEAQELLALARERNGQLAHARAEYEKYLKLYPDGEGADRVKQRLTGLLTARAKPRKRTAVAQAREEKRSQMQVSGSFSQFYRRDVSTTDLTGTTVDTSYLTNDLSATGRIRDKDTDFRVQFNGNYRYDFITAASEDGLVASNLYVDYNNLKTGFSTRVGRQSRSTGGVLGRFDGGVVGYELKPKIRINAVAGYPVNLSTSSSPQTDKYFYGLSMDVGTLAKNLDLTGYVIRQEEAGLVDRQAIGGEMRYFDSNKSFFGLLDYDTHYSELNTALFLANWRFANEATLNLVLDYRLSPVLTTNNAIQGQGVTSLDQLLTTRSEPEIYGLARDRTARSRTVTVSGTYPFNEKLTLSGDLNVTNISGTPASGGVEATPSTGNDYSISAQVIGSGLIKKGDLSIYGLRYSDTSTTKSTTFTMNSRYPFGTKWRLNPRLVVDYADKNTGSTVWTVKPSLRTDYRYDRKLTFQFDVGLEAVRDSAISANDRDSYFLFLGYRKDFY